MVTKNNSHRNRKALAIRAAMEQGHYFFCRRVVLPQDLSEGEEESAALLELENLSPFPLEHMSYGCRIDEARAYAFVYAAYKKRFADGEMGQWGQQDAALPDFSLPLLCGEKGAEPIFCISRKSVCYMEFDAKSELPSFSFCKPIACDEDGVPGPAEEQVAALSKALKRNVDNGRLRIWKTDAEAAQSKDDILLLGKSDSGDALTGKLTRSGLWSMDIRDEAALQEARVAHRRNLVFWKVVQGMAVLLLLLLLGEVIWGAAFGYRMARERQNASQQAQVDAIDEQIRTINELLNYQESNLTPFAMLNAIDIYRYRNNVRTDATHQVRYTKVETNGTDVLVIDAECAQSSHTTAFKDRLSEFDLVESVNLEKVRSDPTGTKFTAVVKFRAGAFYDEDSDRLASR